MADCVFCKIVSGEFESSRIYEDDTILAFMTIQPVNPGHVLVIPKKHVELISGLDDETAGKMFIIAGKINTAIRKSGIKTEAINYFLADGKSAGQEVFHTHLHIFPRFNEDGFGLRFAPGFKEIKARKLLNEAADKIRKAL
jgi:histidine triad (HIT) family protein